MADDETGELLNELGQLLARDTEYPLDGTLLHAMVDTNTISISIFKNRGNHVLYRRADYDLLQDTLFDLWELEEPGKRWEEIAYLVEGGKFDAAFTYPEEIDREELSIDRRARTVRRYFGDKPIVYPPWPPEFGQQFEL